ncbi:MAG: FAD:protein FMN transferase [Longimicrobiales bacterium]
MGDPTRITRRKMLRLTALSGLGLALGAKMIQILIEEGRLHEVRATRSHLGTLVTITAIHPDRSAAHELLDVGFGEMDRLERILSRHRSGSALSQLNRDGRIDPAPAEVVHVLEAALSFSRGSQGAFDPTVTPVLAVYESLAQNGSTELPLGAIEIARAKVDYRRVEVSGSTIRLNGTQLTLDGVAKGYVVDQAVAALVGAGAERVLVDAGGDMATGGSGAPQSPFRISVAHPRHADRRIASAPLAGTAVATSGDYVQRFGPGFGHHHIIDPRTGRSANALSSATVTAPTAIAADALSTAVFVLGPEEGVEFLKDQDRAEGLLVSKTGAVSKTKGWV